MRAPPRIGTRRIEPMARNPFRVRYPTPNPSPQGGGQSHMAGRPKFPLSVSGYALDTSPPEGVEERRELAKTSARPPPRQGGGVEPVGRDGEGAVTRSTRHMRLPCHKGEGDSVAQTPMQITSVDDWQWRLCSGIPSPLWGGVRGG